jgi:hypothetical protein
MRRLDTLSGVLATTVERAHKIEIKTVGRINIVVLFVCCYAVVRTAEGSQEKAEEKKSVRVFVCVLIILILLLFQRAERAVKIFPASSFLE